jgi:hypothetical protein
MFQDDDDDDELLLDAVKSGDGSQTPSDPFGDYFAARLPYRM